MKKHILFSVIAVSLVVISVFAIPPGKPVSISGSYVWTNNTASGNEILENVDQTNNLAVIDFNAGNIVFSTDNEAYPSFSGGLSVLIGNLATQPGANISGSIAIGNTTISTTTNMIDSVAIGGNALSDAVNIISSVAIGQNAGVSGTNGQNNVFIGSDADISIGGSGAATNCIVIGAGAGIQLHAPTNTIVIGANSMASVDNTVEIGNSATDFHTHNGIATASTGFLVHSNTLASLPVLSAGDTFYWSSNGVAYVICSSPSGVLTTNKLGP